MQKIFTNLIIISLLLTLSSFGCQKDMLELDTEITPGQLGISLSQLNDKGQTTVTIPLEVFGSSEEDLVGATLDILVNGEAYITALDVESYYSSSSETIQFLIPSVSSPGPPQLTKIAAPMMAALMYPSGFSDGDKIDLVTHLKSGDVVTYSGAISITEDSAASTTEPTQEDAPAGAPADAPTGAPADAPTGAPADAPADAPAGAPPAGAPPAGAQVKIASEQSKTLVLHKDKLWMWGSLIYSDSAQAEKAVTVSGLSDLQDIAVSNDYFVAVKKDGTVWKWNEESDAIPEQISELTDITEVAAGRYHVVYLKKDGTVLTSGINEYGQLGTGTTSDPDWDQYYVDGPFVPLELVSTLSHIVQITAGRDAVAAIDNNGNVWIWGALYDPALENQSENPTVIQPTPTKIENLDKIKSIAINARSLVAVSEDGSLWEYQPKTPKKAENLDSVTAVILGYDHGLALKSDGTVWGFGYNFAGVFGNGNDWHEENPEAGSVPITSLLINITSGPNLQNVVAIGAGNAHSVAVTSDGKFWTWGDDENGRLGNGSESGDSLLPVEVIKVE